MKNIKSIICIALILPIISCAPQRLQSSKLAEYKQGRPFYNMTGYTDSGDITPGAARKYIEHSLSDACPAGIEIEALREYDSHNAFGKFLYWEAVAGCK